MRSVKNTPDDARDPEEDKKTEIFDPLDAPAPTPLSSIQPAQPAQPTPSPKSRPTSQTAGPRIAERERTRVDKPPRKAPTLPPPIPGTPAKAKPAAPAPPIVATSMKQTGSVQAVSMKTPEDHLIAKPKVAPRPQIPQVKLRPIGSIATESGPIQTPRGNLAPPQDEREARRQRLWSNTFWASIAVIIASLVALAIWLIAGKK